MVPLCSFHDGGISINHKLSQFGLRAVSLSFSCGQGIAGKLCMCVCVCVCLCVRVCARVCVREHKQASLSALPCRQQLNEPSAHTCQYLLVNETPTHAHIVR